MIEEFVTGRKPGKIVVEDWEIELTRDNFNRNGRQIAWASFVVTQIPTVESKVLGGLSIPASKDDAKIIRYILEEIAV